MNTTQLIVEMRPEKKIQILIGQRKFMAYRAQWKVPNL